MIDKTKKPFNMALSPEVRGLFDALHRAKADAEGEDVSMSWYLAWLIRQEAKRQGIDAPKASKNVVTKGTKKAR